MSRPHAAFPEIALRRPVHFPAVRSDSQSLDHRPQGTQDVVRKHIDLQRCNGLRTNMVCDLMTGRGAASYQNLHIVPYSEAASPPLWMALRMLGHFPWDFATSMAQRNGPTNVFPGPADWHGGIDNGFEVALLPTKDALQHFIKTLEQHLASLETDLQDTDRWTLDLSEMERRTGSLQDWPTVSDLSTFPMIAAALPAWVGSPMWEGFNIKQANSGVDYKPRQVRQPVERPTQLPVLFRRSDEDSGNGLPDACQTPERWTFLSMVSVICFAQVEWSLRKSRASREQVRHTRSASLASRPLGQDWLMETEGQDNPTVDHHWVDGYKELLRYAVLLLTSPTPSSFRSRRRPTDHLGFPAPAQPAQLSKAARNFFWSSVKVGPRYKNLRNAPQDRSSSPLDTSDILQRWFAVLTSVEEDNQVKEIQLEALVAEYGGSAEATLAALTSDLRTAFLNTFVEQQHLDVEDLLLRGFDLVPGSERLSKVLVPVLEEMAALALEERNEEQEKGFCAEVSERGPTGDTMSQSSSGESLSSTEGVQALERLGLGSRSVPTSGEKVRQDLLSREQSRTV